MELRGIPEESFQQCIKCGREGWENAFDLRGITLKRKLCSLFFEIEINCL